MSKSKIHSLNLHLWVLLISKSDETMQWLEVKLVNQTDCEENTETATWWHSGFSNFLPPQLQVFVCPSLWLFMKASAWPPSTLFDGYLWNWNVRIWCCVSQEVQKVIVTWPLSINSGDTQLGQTIDQPIKTRKEIAHLDDKLIGEEEASKQKNDWLNCSFDTVRTLRTSETQWIDSPMKTSMIMKGPMQIW